MMTGLGLQEKKRNETVGVYGFGVLKVEPESILDRARRYLKPAKPTIIAPIPPSSIATESSQMPVNVAVSVPPPMVAKLFWAALASLSAF